MTINKIKNVVFNKNIWVYILLLVLFIAIRLPGLGSDILNTDAERWHRRSENFLHALQQKNYVETYQRYHPGVTLMWFNAIVKYVSFKYQLTYTSNPLTLENADYFVLIHGISKAFNVFVFASLLVIQLLFIKKLFGNKVALLFGFLMSVEPYMIGINRWFHQTSFEVMFGFASLLSLLAWYNLDTKKRNLFHEYKYIILSAFFLTFSVLAKVTSLILGPVLLIVFIAKFVKDKKIDFKAVLIYGFSFALFIFAFFPALWVDPVFVFNKMYNPISEAVTDNIRADILAGPLNYLYYAVILLFKLSPVTLILFLISFWGLRKTKDFNVKILILSIFNYYIFLTLTDQKIDRYALIFIPFILLLSSLYLVTLSKKVVSIVLSLSFAFFIYVAYVYYPVYSAYYSPLFGGTNKALSVGVYDNSGEYFAQAMLYLNTKGRDVYTYVPDGFSSSLLFYKGKIQRDRNAQTQYVVKSYDMVRLDPTDPFCTTLDSSFGSKEHAIVFVWRCF